MKRLAITILFVLTLAVCARAQVNSQRVIFTSSNPPTACVAGKVYTNTGLNPAKAWVGTSTGACTEIDASAAAPSNATYITQTPNTTLTNEQALSLLATGIPLITTTTGVISISSVTNDVQTKAAIVPNTAPTSGQILVGNAGGTAYAPVSMSSDATLASTGAITIANNAISLGKMATQATNTVLGNATSGTAVPTALPVGTCSTAGSALIWTTNTGFGCNTSITAAAAPVSGLTGAGTGVLTFLATPSSANLRGALTDELGTGAALFDGATPTSFVCTNCTGTASLNINGTVGATTPAAGTFTTATTSGSSTTQAVSLVVTNTSNASNLTKAAVIDLQTKDTGSTLKTVAQIVAHPDTNVNSNDGAIEFYTRTGDVAPVSNMKIGNTGLISLLSSTYTTCTALTTTTNVIGCTASDAKLKRNVHAISGGLTFIRSVQPRSFSFKPGTPWYDRDRIRVGLIAQDIQKALPEAVFPIGPGLPLQVDYNAVTAKILQALKELDTEFGSYKKATDAKLAEQQRTIRRLKHRR